MDYTFGIYKDASIGAGGYVGREEFSANENQTVFTCTTITLTDDVSVFIEGVLQSNSTYSRNGNTIILTTGVREGTEVVIIN